MRLPIVAICLATATASAQPGQAPPAQPDAPPPPGQTYPPPGYPPPPHGYAPAGYGQPVALTQDEHELLIRGEISDAAHVGGGVASLFIGFGAGQAVQGRWSDSGWKFTVGEVGSLALLFVGVVRVVGNCGYGHETENHHNCGNADGVPLLVAGAVGFGVFRVWEIVDAFAGPGDHNRRVRELKFRVGIPVQISRVRPYLDRVRDGGATAGLRLDF